MLLRVLIRPKEGILDPQGKAVERALPVRTVETLPSRRLAAVEAARERDGLLATWREHAVPTSTLYTAHVEDSAFLFFTDDAVWPRPLFGALNLTSCAEWLWSGYPKDFPNLKIAMSEGGIGWVAMLLDRLDNIIDRSGYGLGWDLRPSEVLKRGFWFCTLDDPSTIDRNTRSWDASPQ